MKTVIYHLAKIEIAKYDDNGIAPRQKPPKKLASIPLHHQNQHFENGNTELDFEKYNYFVGSSICGCPCKKINHGFEFVVLF